MQNDDLPVATGGMGSDLGEVVMREVDVAQLPAAVTLASKFPVQFSTGEGRLVLLGVDGDYYIDARYGSEPRGALELILPALARGLAQGPDGSFFSKELVEPVLFWCMCASLGRVMRYHYIINVDFRLVPDAERWFRATVGCPAKEKPVEYLRNVLAQCALPSARPALQFMEEFTTVGALPMLFTKNHAPCPKDRTTVRVDVKDGKFVVLGQDG